MKHEPWEPDVLSDYNKLRTDEERRSFFEYFQPDLRHLSEYERLMQKPEESAPQASEESDKRKPSDRNELSSVGFWLTLLGALLGIVALFR